MTEHIKQIAERIKGLREISGISAESLAVEFGVAMDLYLQYESGKIDIPIGLLYEISHKFNIELSALLGGENPRLHVYCVVRKGEGLSAERRKQYKYESLAYNFIHKKAEPFIVTVEPEAENSTVEFNSHPGQEFHFVMEGTLKVIIDVHEITLNEGDSLYFDSGYKHCMKALNNKAARLLVVVL